MSGAVVLSGLWTSEDHRVKAKRPTGSASPEGEASGSAVSEPPPYPPQEIEMCGWTGYKVPCGEPGCAGFSTCREIDYCPDHDPENFLLDDEE